MNQYRGQHPNQQHTHATGGGTANVNQNGIQHVNTTNNQYNNTNITNHTHRLTVRNRSRTGWAILVMIVVDVAFSFYGQAAYTGEAGNSGDLWRAGIALALLFTTGSLVRRWFRAR